MRKSSKRFVRHRGYLLPGSGRGGWIAQQASPIFRGGSVGMKDLQYNHYRYLPFVLRLICHFESCTMTRHEIDDLYSPWRALDEDRWQYLGTHVLRIQAGDSGEGCDEGCDAGEGSLMLLTTGGALGCGLG